MRQISDAVNRTRSFAPMDGSGMILACPRKFTLPEGVWNTSLIFVINSSREANSISAALDVVSVKFRHQVFTNTHLCSVRLLFYFLAVGQHVLKLFKLLLLPFFGSPGPLFCEAGVTVSFVVLLW